jgi:hypothetical protein
MRVRPDPNKSRLVGSGTTPSGASDAKLMESLEVSVPLIHVTEPASCESPDSLIHAGVMGHVPSPKPLSESDTNVNVTNDLSGATPKSSSSLMVPFPSPMKIVAGKLDDENTEPVGADRVIEQISTADPHPATVASLLDPDTLTILSVVVSWNVIESALAV